LWIAACDHYSATIRGKFAGNSQSDTAASAGHDSRFAYDFVVH
jgi:hypothetical protein